VAHLSPPPWTVTGACAPAAPERRLGLGLTPLRTHVNFSDAAVSVALHPVDAELLSLAIVEAYDPIVARWTAFAAGIHYPGAISTADEVDLASVVPELIGRKLFPDDLPIRRPSTLQVRRGERKEGRKPAGVGPT
jgi:hypothetical protein